MLTTDSKKTGQFRPEQLMSQCKEVAIHVPYFYGDHLTSQMLSPYNIHFYCDVIFSDFFVLNRHTQKIQHFYLITKRAIGLFWDEKHLLTLCPGHFISGVTGPGYRRIAGFNYRCRNFIANSHTSYLCSQCYFRLSHPR